MHGENEGEKNVNDEMGGGGGTDTEEIKAKKVG